jgi:CubicO group peptidase (beta-lactamase class C family)
MEIHGHCDERFASLREEFERNFAERGDVGASFAATVEGEYVIDIWAGHRDGAKTLPWEEDTIVCVYSTTKTMTALSALVLFDRGELSFDDPVTKFWPEYGQNGKESTEIRHFMGHTAGLPGFGEKLTRPELYDWDHAISVLERQEPWWQPGEECAYHAVTQGFLIGEIVRRISGQSLGTFFRENVAGPLGADFHIGLDPTNFPRTAEMLFGGEIPPQKDDMIPEYMRGREPGVPNIMPPVTNEDGYRQAEIPAANGHGNARSVVRAQTAVANGGSAFGVDLLSSSTIDQIFREQGDMSGMGVKHGIGYGLSGLFTAQLPKDTKICFWGGAGGSTIILDHTNRACLSYVMNQMDMRLLGDVRGGTLTSKFYEGLG